MFTVIIFAIGVDRTNYIGRVIMKKKTDALANVKEIAATIAKAVSGIFPDVEVVVVGEDSLIFASSDKYMPAKGSPMYTPYIKSLLNSKKEVIIDNPGENELCKGCAKAKSCTQKLEIAVPFRIENEWSGYLSMIAFSDKAKKRYLERKDQTVVFLKTLIDVMVKSGKMQVAENAALASAKNLSALLNTIDTVVFMCDAQCNIISYNNNFLDLFGLTESEDTSFSLTSLLPPGNPLEAAIWSGVQFSNREVGILVKDKLMRMIVNFKPIAHSNKFDKEFLFILRSLETVRSLITSAENVMDNQEGIIGCSPEIELVKKNIKQFALSTSTVLIRGETGTGKELVARSLHKLGPRRHKPFVAINCAAIPDSLLESELFGYEQGTFTGANKSGKPGLFELGNGGTIFLDEIGDMPLHLQAKLLRVLQEHQIVRLGGFHPTDLDIRVIAATNQDIETMVDKMRFRPDLFYRLNILPICIPPLRNHLQDMDELVLHFIKTYSDKLGKNIIGADTEFISRLKQYSWPGNIRELENTIEYAVNITKDSVLTLSSCSPDILSAIDNLPASKLTLKEHMASEEARFISSVLKEYGNEKSGVTLAAKSLGISRASLYNKIKEYNIK